MKTRFEKLGSIPFLVCLALLLLNDFYFKPEFHNSLTGKISDFSGLFVFPFFWTLCFPKIKKQIYIFTALGFVLWKSPYSADFINLFSNFLYPINRIVDLSDVWALLILPISYLYLTIPIKRHTWIPSFGIALLCLFAFGATSMHQPAVIMERPQYVLLDSLSIQKKYSQGGTQAQVYKVGALQLLDVKQIGISKEPTREDDYYKAQIKKSVIDLIFQTIGPANGYKSEDEIDEFKNHLLNRVNQQITFESDAFVDTLNFSQARLNGAFSRSFLFKDALISGFYKLGVEDSVWIYSENGIIIKKMFFEEGENIKTEFYENGKSIETNHYSTRSEIITKLYFKLALWLILLIGSIWLIASNRKKTRPIILDGYEKFAFILFLPFSLLFVRSILGSNYPVLWFPQNIFIGFVVYIGCVFFSIIIIFLFLPRKRIDFLWYSLAILSISLIFSDYLYLFSILP